MKSQGHVEFIFIRPQPSKPLLELESVMAVPGRGLQGDYYSIGKQGKKSDPGREVTLIEVEAISEVEQEHHIKLEPRETRRNIITQNVPLNQLVGMRFRVGEVILEGIRLCEPCMHLAELTQKEVIPAFVHKGGLRAQILTEGTIRIGDPVVPQNGGFVE